MSGAIEGLNGAEMARAIEQQRLQRGSWCWFRRARAWVEHPHGFGLVAPTRGMHAGSPMVAGSELSLCLGFRVIGVRATPVFGQLQLFTGNGS